MIKVIRGAIEGTVNQYVSRKKNPEMMDSEFGVIYLREKEVFEIATNEEYVFCLNCGTVCLEWDGKMETGERKSCFTDDPYVLHVHSGTQVRITALSQEAEINVANTPNERQFENKLYRPEDLFFRGIVDEEKLGGRVKRIKREFFNRTVCPETNLFCGEVVNFPGSWACFPPHLHQEPEIYYYKFLPDQGYGFSEFGNEAIKVVNRSVTCNPGGQLHSQATAPGYAGYIMWTQRLQDGGGDIIYSTDENHAWLEARDAKLFPERIE
ncbi:MAG: 5-deoxy-glucuronate isomerase [Lachnospiraceae bacterium]|jgi:5-deoxy-glucuronate isomerase|nr:5-deoxy-glucuronate isomerase [Lachnospiraceae bacterium]